MNGLLFEYMYYDNYGMSRLQPLTKLFMTETRRTFSSNTWNNLPNPEGIVNPNHKELLNSLSPNAQKYVILVIPLEANADLDVVLLFCFTISE